ncbi:MAG: hypothetical protein EXS13_00380 [Planctomycetes bacterium]|nr:hypothetical protein [Planctomycetota bacterium]
MSAAPLVAALLVAFLVAVPLVPAPAVGAAASSCAIGESLLDTLRVELSASEPARRQAAFDRLRHELAPTELSRLLAEMPTAMPSLAVAYERVAMELPRLRAALLRLALAGDATAELLLCAAFRQRATELEPYRSALADLREHRLPWSRPGWRGARSGLARARLSWPELELTLRSAGAFEQPVVVLPGCLRDGVTAPLPLEVSLDGWLEVELRRRGLVAVRGTVAAWILPYDRAAEFGAHEAEKASLELLELHQCEQQWFRAALVACRGLPVAEQGRAAGDLLLRTRLCWAEGSSGDSDFDRALGEAHAAFAPWMDAPVRVRAMLPSSTESVPTLVALRRELDDWLAGAAAPANAPLDRLTDLVDCASGVALSEPLLCGELADALRKALPALGAGVVHDACKDASAELLTIGRAARPGSARVVLPGGAGGVGVGVSVGGVGGDAGSDGDRR